MDAMTSTAALDQLETSAKSRFNLPSRRTLLASAIAIAVALAGAAWIIAPPTSESTDDVCRCGRGQGRCHAGQGADCARSSRGL